MIHKAVTLDVYPSGFVPAVRAGWRLSSAYVRDEDRTLRLKLGAADRWTVGKGVEVAVPPQANTVAIIASHQNDFISYVPTPKTNPGFIPGRRLID